MDTDWFLNYSKDFQWPELAFLKISFNNETAQTDGESAWNHKFNYHPYTYLSVYQLKTCVFRNLGKVKGNKYKITNSLLLYSDWSEIRDSRIEPYS